MTHDVFVGSFRSSSLASSAKNEHGWGQRERVRERELRGAHYSVSKNFLEVEVGNRSSASRLEEVAKAIKSAIKI